jgi:putative Mg2+ transporter-C (MgtC) family protein
MEQITAPDNIIDCIFRLGLSILLGAAIGINRELLRKPAGLQTHSLVALGSALVSIISVQLAESLNDGSAVSRMIQGLVAGIGFIGGGVIMHRRDSQGVYGLTTAASIWVVAGMGIAVGLGLWRLSMVAVAMSLGILIVFGSIDHWLVKKNIRIDTGETPPPAEDSESIPPANRR